MGERGESEGVRERGFFFGGGFLRGPERPERPERPEGTERRRGRNDRRGRKGKGKKRSEGEDTSAPKGKGGKKRG